VASGDLSPAQLKNRFSAAKPLKSGSKVLAAIVAFHALPKDRCTRAPVFWSKIQLRSSPRIKSSFGRGLRGLPVETEKSPRRPGGRRARWEYPRALRSPLAGTLGCLKGARRAAAGDLFEIGELDLIVTLRRRFPCAGSTPTSSARRGMRASLALGRQVFRRWFPNCRTCADGPAHRRSSPPVRLRKYTRPPCGIPFQVFPETSADRHRCGCPGASSFGGDGTDAVNFFDGQFFDESGPLLRHSRIVGRLAVVEASFARNLIIGNPRRGREPRFARRSGRGFSLRGRRRWKGPADFR